MTRYLLDTNVLSELRRRHPDRKVIAFFEAQALEDLFIADATLAEIRFGALVAWDAALRAVIEEWLDRVVRPLFAGRVLGAGEDVWLRWCVLNAEGRRAGYTYPQPDLVLAAIAAQHGLTVATRDTEPFLRAGVPVLNPWTA